MNRILSFSFVLVLLLLSSLGSYGQATVHVSEDQLPSLVNLNSHINGDTLNIDFTISHEANLEFSLHDNEGEPIWATQYLEKKGSHRISLNLTPLEGKGMTYSYNLVYKGKHHSREFSY